MAKMRQFPVRFTPEEEAEMRRHARLLAGGNIAAYIRAAVARAMSEERETLAKIEEVMQQHSDSLAQSHECE
jgi:hypothetical protein